MDTITEFKLAKLAREKGFDKTLCNGYYHHNEVYIQSSTKCCNDRLADSCYAAPTLYTLQSWLRKQGKEVIVERMAIQNTLNGRMYFACIYQSNEDYQETEDVPNFEWALKLGLEVALNSL